MIKTSLYCLAIALCLRLAYSQALAPAKITEDLPWLIVRTNHQHTVIYSLRKPVVTSGAGQNWTIEFVKTP
jgi:hypothetical protein